VIRATLTVMVRQDEIRALNEVVVKSRTDGELRRRLLSEPASLLKEAGITFLEGALIRVVENSDDKVHVVLPDAKSFDGLSREFLEEFALYAVVRRAREDRAFRARLVDETPDALAESGIHVPAGVEVRVLLNDERLVHIALPALGDELREADLDSVHGGVLATSELEARTIAWGGPTLTSPSDWVGSFI